MDSNSTERTWFHRQTPFSAGRRSFPSKFSHFHKYWWSEIWNRKAKNFQNLEGNGRLPAENGVCRWNQVLSVEFESSWRQENTQNFKQFQQNHRQMSNFWKFSTESSILMSRKHVGMHNSRHDRRGENYAFPHASSTSKSKILSKISRNSTFGDGFAEIA